MCTLTVYSGKKRCVVTMNRDELRTRKEAGVLHSKSSNGVRLFYPVDLVSGGTWFGVNNKGVTLALLNRYQAPQKENPKSRGDIIPGALAQGGRLAVKSWLQQLPYADYNPFDLFLISKKQVMHFAWDAEQYVSESIDFKHWFMVTSSSLMTEEVIAYRQNLFKAWSSEMGKKLAASEEILRGFHLIQFEGMETHSVLMEREKSHTRSVIQADLDGEKMQLKYIPDILENSLDAPLAGVQEALLEIRKT